MKEVAMQFSFVIFGPPQPKQRPRVTSRGTFTPAATRRYEKTVNDRAHVALVDFEIEQRCWPLDGEYELDCRFYMGSYRPCDTDNLIKSISDGIEGVVVENDNQFSKVSGLRIYGDPNPRTEVTVTWLGPKPKRAKGKKL